VTLTNEVAIYSVVLFNRTSCCGSRLRDITIEILSTNATGTVTNWTSTLLNPENAGFTYPAGPASISNNLVTLTGGPVFGRSVRVRRTPDPDLSGSGGQGNTDEAAVLSLGEVVTYGTGASGLRPCFSTDLQGLMLGRNASAFVRMPFTSTSTPDTLALRVRYDDGFIAYLNGVEIARRNAPVTPAWNSAATADRNLASAIAQETMDLSGSIPALVSGANVLAVQALNFSPNNPDLLFQAELTATRSQTTPNVHFTDATPGSANTTEWYYDEVADTQFSVDRGFHDAPFAVEITSATPDAVIYYSFNGDEPGPGKGILYTGPITITNTTVLRTRAFKENWKATDVDSASYIFLNDVIYQVPNWPANRIPPPYFPATWGANAVDYGMDPEIVTNFTLAQWREALTQIPTLSIVTEMRHLFDATTASTPTPASMANCGNGRSRSNCSIRPTRCMGVSRKTAACAFAAGSAAMLISGNTPSASSSGANMERASSIIRSSRTKARKNSKPSICGRARTIRGRAAAKVRRSRRWSARSGAANPGRHGPAVSALPLLSPLSQRAIWGFETDERPEASMGKPTSAAANELRCGQMRQSRRDSYFRHRSDGR
jgi:hypothetical protein